MAKKEMVELHDEPHGLEIGDKVVVRRLSGQFWDEAVVCQLDGGRHGPDDGTNRIQLSIPRVGMRSFNRICGKCQKQGIWWRATAVKTMGYGYFSIEKKGSD